ncbi:hypothetical protein [Sphingomonas turrisvirgatae]|uniref:Uncharacterized protein n=1 Tax=Sphingomonas turrisvirgatae TaxID=1888892 RepID=A0A1E3LZE5_9SPHN|nr:hypothetical protein [Sphingomonas turrisvirgatae]ODP39099.1 hypothetical protein BFL28_12125 [Sphingomonas turrisvirgatae]
MEEIAFNKGFVTADHPRAAGERISRTGYGRAILNAVDGRWTAGRQKRVGDDLEYGPKAVAHCRPFRPIFRP